MAKKAYGHRFDTGGDIGDSTTPSWKDNWKDGKGLGTAMGIASTAGSIFGSAYSIATPNTDDMLENVDAEVKALKNSKKGVQASSLDDLMAQWSDWRALDTDFNTEDYYVGPKNGDIFKNTLSSTISGASTGATAGGGFGALAGAIVGLGSGLIGGLIGKHQGEIAARQAVNKKKKAAEEYNAFKEASFITSAQGLTAKNNRLLATQAAYGGPLGISLLPVSGAIDYMQNEELLSSLGENMTKNNNSRTSMPTFAFGGALPGYGGDWSNGLNFIKAGKRHEQNPIGGVPMGVAQDGVPNLVEEGEVIWNDYVFSNRIRIPKSVREKFKLKGGDNMTFAEAVEKAQKASAERPNDPIEKRTLDTLLAGLMQEQETIRQKKAQKEQFSQMEDMAAFAADGGPIHIAKNKRGTFTAAATKHGMGVQEFAGHVLANKDKYSSAMVKKAVFAHNSKSWSHANGGPLKKGKYEDWYKTIPADRNDTTSYNLKRAYELAPYDELEAWRTSSIRDLNAGKNHLRSIYLNPDTGIYEFMKSKNHPTLHFETDWYNSNDPEAVEFRKNYDLDMSGNYYKYVPKKKAFGGDLNTLGGHLFALGGEEDPFDFLSRVKRDNEARMVNAPLADTTTPRQKAILAIATGTPEGQQAAYEYWKTTQDPELFKNATTPEVKSETPTTPNTTTPNTTLPTSGWQTMLRYAPIVGGIGTVFSDLKGWTNKPDYQYADAIDAAAEKAASGYTHVGYTPLGDYLAYNPFDRLFYANELGAQQAATRRGILNLSNGNRGTALAGLLAADYSGNIGLGKLFREGEEYNLAQRQKVAEFNRATNMYNSEADLKAQIANAETDRLKANLLYEAALKSNLMRQQEDQTSNAAKAANLNALFENLGSMGQEYLDRYRLNALLNSGWAGTLNTSMKNITANGGRISRKKKKGLTI